jgi:hypothetical protein
MSWNVALLAGALIALTAVASGACGGDSGPPGATPSPSAQANATAVPTRTPMSSDPTGIVAVDGAIAAIKSGDVDALVDLMLLEPERCAPPAGAGGPPACNAGEATGTEIDVVPIVSCEAGWGREAALPQVLSSLAGGEATLFAVYRGDESVFGRRGDYGVIFTYHTATGDIARNFVMTDNGVVGVDLGCGESAHQMVERHKLTDVVFARGG